MGAPWLSKWGMGRARELCARRWDSKEHLPGTLSRQALLEVGLLRPQLYVKIQAKPDASPLIPSEPFCRRGRALPLRHSEPAGEVHPCQHNIL